MKLTTTTQVSLDGVVQGGGGEGEDSIDGFERGGWAMPYLDSEVRAFLLEVYERADAFLFGRKTYEIFDRFWGVTDPDKNEFAAALTSKTKYVPSKTLTDPHWANTTVLSGDLATAVGELKAQSGGELQVHGSAALTRWLLEHDFVDEMNFLIAPVVVGQGMRLFPEAGLDIALDLIESRSFPTGVTLQVYRPAGRPRYIHAR